MSLISAALTGAALLSVALSFPTTGIDGGEGIRMRDAVLTAVEDLRGHGIDIAIVNPAGAQPVENPHQDEGTDNEADVVAAPSVVEAANRAGVRILIGPLTSNVAVGEDAALARLNAVAITGTAEAPSEPNSRVFKLAPSERQLAAAAYTWMRDKFGARICVIDDGTPDGLRRAAALRDLRTGIVQGDCVGRSDAVYFATLGREPIFCSAQTALRADPGKLLIAVSHRGFEPADFAQDGALYRAEPAPIARTPQLAQISERYHARAFVAADDAALRTYAAVEIAAQVAAATRSGGDPAVFLRSRQFLTALGPMRFDVDGDPISPRVAIDRLN